jgi:ornithine cyclodeaminase
VICTVTASPAPILAPEWIKPGCHINAVGASSPNARELGSAIIAGAELFVDSREQAAAECGEYLLARSEGAIPDTHIRAEIGEVLAGARRGRSDAKAITVFKSLGLAVEDLAAADRAIRNAQDLGLGKRVSW